MIPIHFITKTSYGIPVGNNNNLKMRFLIAIDVRFAQCEGYSYSHTLDLE